MDSYRIPDPGTYSRPGVFRHFSGDARCSMSVTARADVTGLAAFPQETGSSFYLNFLSVLCRVLNSREGCRMGYP